MGQIYLSSTYEDLKDFRAAAREAILRQDHHPIGMEDYGATESRPLDRCLADIDNCIAYIGVIGFRCGFKLRGQQKSITQLEYDHAGEIGIPRLMFLADEGSWPAAKIDRNREQIDAFRAALEDRHMVDRFVSFDDLKYKISSQISREIGRGLKVPTLLPYRVNRFEHAGEYWDHLNSVDPSFSQPAITYIHGSEQQALERFVDCLCADTAAELRLSDDIPITRLKVPWSNESDPAAFRTSLLRSLAGKLPTRPRPKSDAIAEALDAITGPVIITSRAYVEKWDQNGKHLFDTFNAELNNLPLNTRRFPIMVVVTVSLREHTGFFNFRQKRRNEMICDDLERLKSMTSDLPIFVVRELDDVARHFALEWCDLKPVLDITMEADLLDEIDGIFDGDDSMAMRPLALEMKSMLQRCGIRSGAPSIQGATNVGTRTTQSAN